MQLRADKLAARSLFVFGVLLVSATAFACVVFPLLLSVAPVDPTSAARLHRARSGEAVQAASPPTIGEWLAALAPGNAVAAAAEGAILPLVVFALFFGFAATQLPAQQRAPMVAFFRAVADTMIIIVRWVLLAAPLGVFALALGVGLTAGVGIAGLIAHYIVLVSAVTAAIVPIAFLFAFLWGRANPARFLNADGAGAGGGDLEPLVARLPAADGRARARCDGHAASAWRTSSCRWRSRSSA